MELAASEAFGKEMAEMMWLCMFMFGFYFYMCMYICVYVHTLIVTTGFLRWENSPSRKEIELHQFGPEISVKGHI